MNWPSCVDASVAGSVPRCRLRWAMEAPYSLLAEGGAQRGVSTLGTLSGLRLAGLPSPHLAVGPSAGVVALIAALALSPGECLAFVPRLLQDSVVRARFPPFDTDRLVALIEVTCRERAIELALQRTRVITPLLAACSGAIVYVALTPANWRVVVRAACAVPLLNGRVVRLDGVDYLDGSIGLPVVPLHEARLPALAVLTRRARPTRGCTRSRIMGLLAAAAMPRVSLAARKRWLERDLDDIRDRAVVLGLEPAPIPWHAITPAPGQAVPSRVSFDQSLLLRAVVQAAHRGVAAAWGSDAEWPDVVRRRFDDHIRAAGSVSPSVRLDREAHP